MNGKLQLEINKGFIDPSNIILGADDRLLLGSQVNGDLLVTKYDIGGTNDLTGRTSLPGVLTFDRSDYSINEDGTKIVNVTVNRTGGSDGNVSATINLTDGTAKAGEDYNSSPITVSFADKETSKTIEIPIVNDAVYEPTETVNLTLSNPTNGATLGSQATASLSILDNDAIINNDPQVPKLTQPIPNILSIEGGGDKSTLKFTKIAQEGAGKNEGFAFVVDDDKGRIGGIAPGSAEYLKAALDRSKVIFSNLGNNSVDRKFDLGSQRSLTWYSR